MVSKPIEHEKVFVHAWPRYSLPFKKKKIVQQLKAEIKFFKVLQRLFIHDKINEIIKLI